MRERSIAVRGGREGPLRFLVVRCPEHSPAGKRQCVVEIITAPVRAEEAGAVRKLGERMMAMGTVTGFAHSGRLSAGAVAYGEKTIFTLGETAIAERFGPVTLTAPTQAFLQVNTLAATLLYERVRELASAVKARVIWDLYSGAGGIALTLAAPGRAVRGFENVPEAVRRARTNAEGAPGSVSFTRCDAAALPADTQPPPDLVVLDPPRAGIAAPLVERLPSLRPRHIISVGCDPAAQARDIALLSPAYRLEQAGAVDLFPQTPHVEAYALLTLRE
jgi:23S rRNA (uracil1939-C5)-methyltransferase